MTAYVFDQNGYWYIILKYQVNGKWKQKWVPTGLKIRGNKKNAQNMIPEIMREYAYLESGIKDRETYFIPFLDKWCENHREEIQPNSYESIVTNIKAHIKPYFEDSHYRLEDITPRIIDDFYIYLSKEGNHKTNEGLCTASIKKISSILKQCFNWACVRELITENPARDVKVPKVKRRKAVQHVYMNSEDANKIIKAFDGHQLKPLVFITLFYGLRRSEVIGLRWENVDLENSTFEIKSTIVRHRTLIEKDSTKTEDSNAMYEMLPQIKQIFLNLKAEQDKNRELFGSAYQDDGYVFTWANGRFFKPDYVSNEFKKVVTKAGLPPMRFHDLRHSTASILFDMGWDIEKIKCWLRHADIDTTSNIYTHISKERKKIMAQELQDLYEF